MDIEKKVISIVQENVEMDIQVREDSRLVDDLNLDSLSLVHIVMGLERTFAFAIEDHEINSNNFYSISRIIQFVRSKL